MRKIMRSILALTLVLATVFSMAPAALAAATSTCASCGEEVASNYCAECGGYSAISEREKTIPTGEDAGDILPASWGAKMARSRGRSFPFGMEEPAYGEIGWTYPLVLDQPLRRCRGFILEYEVMEVTQGEMKDNYFYEVLIQTVGGEWKSAGLFRMDDYSATLRVELEERRSVKAIAVVNASPAVFNFTMRVRDAF